MVQHADVYTYAIHSRTRDVGDIPDDGTEVGTVSTTHPLGLPIHAALSRSRDPETVLASIDGMRRACNIATEDAREAVARLLVATKL